MISFISSHARALLFGAAFLTLTAWMSLTAQAITEEEALQDWNALHDAYDRLDSKLGDILPSHIPNIIGTEYDSILALMKEVETQDVPKISKQLVAFAGKYGKTSEQINQAMREVVKIDWHSGRHPREEAGMLYEKLSKRISDIPLAKERKAEEMLREAEGVQSTIDAFSRQVNEENYEKLRIKLDLALQFDPQNEKAKEWLGRLDSDKEKAFAAIERSINEAKWPGHYSNFSGPGNPDQLAASAMDWLRKDEAFRGKQDPDHTFAVCVRGDWWVAKRNILGQPIQWGLPIYAACHDSKEKAKGLCRVFSLTILTQEGPEIPQAPPWTGVTVGDNYTMKIAHVKSSGVADSGQGQRFPFAVRIFLSLALLSAGFVLVSPWIKKTIAPLENLEKNIVPLSKWIGIVVWIVAGLSLVNSVILSGFHPLSELLPQVAGILAGLALLKGSIAGQQAVYLGFACLFLGLLHFLAGGLPLF